MTVLVSQNILFQATLHMKTPFDPSNDRIQVTMKLKVILFWVLKQKHDIAIKMGFHYRTDWSCVDCRADMMLLAERQRANISNRWYLLLTFLSDRFKFFNWISPGEAEWSHALKTSSLIRFFSTSILRHNRYNWSSDVYTTCMHYTYIFCCCHHYSYTYSFFSHRYVFLNLYDKQTHK